MRLFLGKCSYWKQFTLSSNFDSFDNERNRCDINQFLLLLCLLLGSHCHSLSLHYTSLAQEVKSIVIIALRLLLHCWLTPAPALSCICSSCILLLPLVYGLLHLMQVLVSPRLCLVKTWLILMLLLRLLRGTTHCSTTTPTTGNTDIGHDLSMSFILRDCRTV